MCVDGYRFLNVRICCFSLSLLLTSVNITCGLDCWVDKAKHSNDLTLVSGNRSEYFNCFTDLTIRKLIKVNELSKKKTVY